MKTEYEEKWDWAVQNENKPLWLQDSKNVTKEQYENFYKTTFGEFLEPAAYSHFSVEGTLEFSSLLFIPGMAPIDRVSVLLTPVKSQHELFAGHGGYS